MSVAKSLYVQSSATKSLIAEKYAIYILFLSQEKAICFNSQTESQCLFGPPQNSFHYWSALRGPRDVKKSLFFTNVFPKDCPKKTQTSKTIKIEEKMSKNPVFLDFFEYSSN